VHRLGKTLRSTPVAEDRFSTGPTVTTEAVLYPVAAAEHIQPRRKWGTKKLEVETAAASSRQS
jgi:hypothetical protein